MGGWGRLVRELGQSWLDVLRAELQGLEDDFARSGHHLKRGVGLFGGAVALGFWAVGALVVAAIAGLATWLPLWAAGLIVALVFAVVAAGLAALGQKSVAQVENPIGVARRRLEDHIDWVQGRLLATAEAADAGETREGKKSRRSDPPYDDFEEELP
ncbi:MAG: phage holin family protein [Acidobacteriota bacterium]